MRVPGREVPSLRTCTLGGQSLTASGRGRLSFHGIAVQRNSPLSTPGTVKPGGMPQPIRRRMNAAYRDPGAFSLPEIRSFEYQGPGVGHTRWPPGSLQRSPYSRHWSPGALAAPPPVATRLLVPWAQWTFWQCVASGPRKIRLGTTCRRRLVVLAAKCTTTRGVTMAVLSLGRGDPFRAGGDIVLATASSRIPLGDLLGFVCESGERPVRRYTSSSRRP